MYIYIYIYIYIYVYVHIYIDMCVYMDKAGEGSRWAPSLWAVGFPQEQPLPPPLRFAPLPSPPDHRTALCRDKIVVKSSTIFIPPGIYSE